MKNRRAFLVTGAVALPAFALSGRRSMSPEPEKTPPAIVPCRKPGGPSAHFFPNVVVRTHHGEKALFYDDLLRDKIVAIHFMSVRGDAVYPVTENLVKVQRLLGERVGRDIFMYSVTVDPEHDTPDVLKEFAVKYGVGPGWLFLTGESAAMRMLHSHLFVRRDFPSAALRPAAHHGPDCSLGLVRYGNEALGRWGSFPARITPESIAERFSWIGMRKESANPVRGEPRSLTS